jgi:hypothetical protein
MESSEEELQRSIGWGSVSKSVELAGKRVEIREVRGPVGDGILAKLGLADAEGVAPMQIHARARPLGSRMALMKFSGMTSLSPPGPRVPADY